MAQHRYDTYGVRGVSLAEARTRVEQALRIELTERDSSYYAGAYFLYRLTHGRQIRVYSNYDEVEPGWVHEEYRPCLVIIAVSDLEDMDEVQVRLQGALDIVLLKRAVLKDEDSAAED